MPPSLPMPSSLPLQLAQGRRGVEAPAEPRRALAGGGRHRGRLRLRLPEGAGELGLLAWQGNA